VNAAAHVSQKSLMTLYYDARNVEARQSMAISRMNLMRRMNNMTWLWFIVGILISAYFGFFIATVLIANKIAEIEKEDK
jgi:formate-dependent nitrite reductase membrane component NrfD